VADFDQDNDVDPDDFAALSACFTGPDIPVDRDSRPECISKNLDGDLMPGHDTGDVDGKDYILFQACMSGPDVPPPPHCTGGPPPPGNFGLHGRPVDVFSDPNGGRHALLFVRARHYDLTNGRWLQRDPLGYADGPNLYEAFGGNPLANVDPDGLDTVKAEGDYLVYYSSGFNWNFARIIYPGIVVIDHPRWPFAFIMKQEDAIAAFDTGPLDSDFYSPEEIMSRATYWAFASGTISHVIAIFDKRTKSRGWITKGRLESEGRNGDASSS
jgi:RHS repeat-associated protein